MARELPHQTSAFVHKEMVMRIASSLSALVALALVVGTDAPVWGEVPRRVMIDDMECDIGEWAACHRVGVALMEDGQLNRAAEYLSKACSGGHQASCSRLSELRSGGAEAGGGLARLAAGDDPTGCRKGSRPLANAFVRADSVMAHYLGDLDSYVRAHREHFVMEGDSIRCARALSSALRAKAIASYDPEWRKARDRLDTRVMELGGTPGPYQVSPAERLAAISMLMAQLADRLPAVAERRVESFMTPEQKAATDTWNSLMLMPEIAEVFQFLEPLARDVAALEAGMIIGWASELSS
jgi:hypothetical protein